MTIALTDKLEVIDNDLRVALGVHFRDIHSDDETD